MASLPREPATPTVLWLYALSGFCALGYEILWSRQLTLLLGNSVYAFSLELAIILTGIGLGSVAWTRFKTTNDSLAAAGVPAADVPPHSTNGSGLAAFGGYLLNNDVEVVNKANDLCNRAGIDTIAAGTIVGFAIECYENGILTRADTDGIELKWGDGPSIVALTEKIVSREGIGDVLADGVKVAAERIGRGAEKFAVHIGGQELGMHDPKLQPELEQASGARYVIDATPGRHTQGFGRTNVSMLWHIVNASGVCLFGYGGAERRKTIAEALSAVTGWERDWGEIEVCAERIMAMRQSFNSREGINNRRDWPVHPRILGNPPHDAGPLKGVTIDLDEQLDYHMKAMGWDPATCKPRKDTLVRLGLDDVARDLWG
jgi:aldehyde:ferredoxin oxidoreductase